MLDIHSDSLSCIHQLKPNCNLYSCLFTNGSTKATSPMLYSNCNLLIFKGYSMCDVKNTAAELILNNKKLK